MLPIHLHPAVDIDIDTPAIGSYIAQLAVLIQKQRPAFFGRITALTEGLVLQQKDIWKRFLGKKITVESNSCELYFEEPDLEGFVEKLDRLYPSVQYVNRLMTHSWGQKVVRFYDLDGNLIEVGTPM